jgi:histone H3/H4
MSDSNDLADLVVAPENETKPVKKRRKNQAQHIKREINKEMKSTKPGIPRAPLKRLIREIVDSLNSDLHIAPQAYTILHDVVEEKLTGIFTRCQEQMLIAHKKTITAHYFAYNSGAAAIDNNGTGWLQPRKKSQAPIRIFRSVKTLTS